MVSLLLGILFAVGAIFYVSMISRENKSNRDYDIWKMSKTEREVYWKWCEKHARNPFLDDTMFIWRRERRKYGFE